MICKSDSIFCAAAALYNASEGLPELIFQKLVKAHGDLGTVDLTSLVQIINTESEVVIKFTKVTIGESHTFSLLYRNFLSANKGIYVISYAVGVSNSHTIYWNSENKFIIDSDVKNEKPLVYENESDIDRIVQQLHANVIFERVLSVYKGVVLNPHKQSRKKRKHNA